jgi:prepilin-type N-terminal cleavage/methylation domain-containing protein
VGLADSQSKIQNLKSKIISLPHLVTLSPCHLVTSRRRGFSLIELLVVVSLLLLLVAITVPKLTPNRDARRLREAARAVAGFLDSARTQAMESGQPVGVAIQRMAANNNVAMVLNQVESPPPYTGDYPATVIGLTAPSGGSKQVSTPVGYAWTANVWFSDTAPPTSSSWYAAPKGDYGLYVQDGDFLRVNQQGYMWQVFQTATSTWTFAQATGFSNMASQTPPIYPSATSGTPPPPTGPGMPFQFYPQPNPGRMLRSAAAALELPVPAVIDLWASGGGTVATDPALQAFQPASATDTNPVIIMFNSLGTVDSVSYGGVRYTVTETMYLLLGNRDQAPLSSGAPTSATLPSAMPAPPLDFAEPNGRWVVIDPHSGATVVTDVDLSDARAAYSNTNPAAAIAASRQFGATGDTGMLDVGGQ